MSEGVPKMSAESSSTHEIEMIEKGLERKGEPIVPTTEVPLPDAQFVLTGNVSIDTALAELLPKEGLPCLGLAQFTNILWCHEHPVFKVALDDWERQEKFYGARVEQFKKAILDRNNQIVTYVAGFVAFMGLIFTLMTQLAAASDHKHDHLLSERAIGNFTKKISSAHSLRCHLVWFPIVLTGMAAIFAGIAIWTKIVVVQDLGDKLELEEEKHKEVVLKLEQLRLLGPKFQFEVLELNTFQRNTLQRTERKKKERMWNLHKLGLGFAFLVFIGTFLFAHLAIMCDG